MRTSDFYAVAPLMPVNKTAGNVTAKGEQFRFKGPEHHRSSDVPLPSKPVPFSLNRENMIGVKVGRLTVVSYAANQNPKKSSLWNVRCVCGRYEQRRRKSLLDAEYAKRAACNECDRVAENRKMYGVEAARKRDALNAKTSRYVEL